MVEDYNFSTKVDIKRTRYNRYLQEVQSSIVYIDDLPDEVWRPVVGTRKYYISNMGRAKSRVKKKEILLKQRIRKGGNAPYVTLRHAMPHKHMGVAKAVYESFIIGKRFDGVFSWYPIDGDYNNCAATNIGEYISPKKIILDDTGKKIMEYFWSNIDNDDKTISQKFNISKSAVSQFISEQLDIHFNKIKDRVNGI